jgi:DNA-binding response OmpR family regulator
VGRADIAEHVWDETFDPFSNLIEVYIQRLRRKIDEGHALKLIGTRRGKPNRLPGASRLSNFGPKIS